MDIDLGNIVSLVVASTTSQIGAFAPLFYLVGGLVLAMVVIVFMISLFTGRTIDPFAEASGILDE